MPELPEVETTRRGIAPHVVGQTVTAVRVREPRLRWPVPAALSKQLTGQRITAVDRRAKYLLLRTQSGTALSHLGMSGSLRLVDADAPYKKHDHIDIGFDNGRHLRYHDPRRFGALLWTDAPPEQHPLLAKLGPEPLGDDFDGTRLYRLSRGRKIPVKTLIMNAAVVVGVGNIYASEALFLAGVRPQRQAGGIAAARYTRLAKEIKQVLAAAIAQGGTTLRDFVNSSGEPGYFSQSLHVYGRADERCDACGAAIKALRIGQRSSFYCPRCQR